MQKAELIARVKKALRKLLESEKTLFQEDISERAVTHQLANYLKHQFSDFDVDCEYNRSKDGPKAINPAASADANELYTEYKMHSKNQGKADSPKAVSIFPDVIIHKRRQSDETHNLLVVEVKKGKKLDARDNCKLRAFTAKIGVDFKYEYGLFLAFRFAEENFDVRKAVLFEDGNPEDVTALFAGWREAE